ncbi:amidohydrolase family protein [Dactylosporangium roseum]|uniref:Amidohydrolase family protein n=1 Tax=Dactylosporangium roseum TaxID=47989 RepID=A0ABY5YZ03_9ACTN|nr:amidohydrolase family protein [Dactylosporangium roseum]UWZ34093.1 amidohydrolase family protein [Dactylosporangium roseum]
MIVDFHARLAPRPGAAEALLAAMDGAGITRAAVAAGGLLDLDRLAEQIIAGGRSEAAADNEAVRRACAGSAGRLLPFFLADPRRDVAAYRAGAAGYRGLELSPAVHGFRLDEPGVTALVRVAAAAGHPVYVVCLGRPGTRAEDLVRLARAHPEVAFVSGHCGHTGLDTSGLTRIAPVPNIHAELSGCLTVTARLAVERLGPGRVLFGTEHPLQHPSVELAKLAALGLSDGDRDQVAGGNARRLLRLETL